MEMLDINYILKIVYPDVVPMNTLFGEFCKPNAPQVLISMFNYMY